MNKILDNVNYPEDLKKLNILEKQELANEIRKYILEIVSNNGGHLASNLGVVELTIAIHSVFNCPNDKVVWDVGHQSYVHKILTGRKEEMKTLRKMGGISGFPKTSESEYDSFDTGHSSTSISVALGMARANELQNKKDRIVAVIGDGSLTGGMAMEALNDAGSSKTNITVILNDNEMSISKNVGGIPALLTKIRVKKTYKTSNNCIKRFFNKIPIIGKPIIKLAHLIKRGIKQAIIPNMYFEDIGFTYLGPVDGHNIQELESILHKSQNIDGPILIHVMTKKGKGYEIAEKNPDKFHGISSFDIKTGKDKTKKTKDYSKIFGDKLIKLASKDEKIVAITAAMKDGTGLKEFAEKFPERFFDVGIAEQHAVGLIAGMATLGLKPIFAVYSSFLQRGYDQLVHDIAIQNLPVTICIDRAGIVGNDGETHQGLFDLAFLSQIPNFTVMAPKNFKELEKMLQFAINLNKPVAIRYPRGGEGRVKFDKCKDIKLGKAEIIKEGKDLSLIAIGKMVERAVEVSELLKQQSIDAEVINARFLKPLDKETILKSAEKTKNIVTIEDGIIKGGLGAAVVECINNSNLENVKVKTFGYDDIFVKHGSVEEIEKENKLDCETIFKTIIDNKKI
ncbi:MAG: 1-deoxy-D-xylulose-5-phosphate synthase [Clostridia bacterium]|nr:1-deoxy-D-xylulose-5-phosphate synthase [Clostridia bacterium]